MSVELEMSSLSRHSSYGGAILLPLTLEQREGQGHCTGEVGALIEHCNFGCYMCNKIEAFDRSL